MEEILKWIWPRFRRMDIQPYFSPAQKQAPAPAKSKDPHTQFVGYSQEGAVVKTRVFEWNADGSTDWATIKQFEKGREKMGHISETLTGNDKLELLKRKPRVSEAAAATMKETYHAKGGAVSASELALATGYSKAYAETCLAAFRAALLREGEAQN